MSREAMKLALEALERYQVKRQDFDRFADEITALREALAEQPAQQEPVAWGVDWGKAGDIPCVSIIKRLPGGGIEVVAVEYAPYSYTSPPAQQEPVAWYRDEDGIRIYYESKVWDDATPLYTSPPAQRKPAQQQEPVAWRNAALRVGEDLCSVGPFGYYDMTAEQWLDWALSVVTVHAPPRTQPPAQRTWVGLTDEEVDEWTPEIHTVIRAIEAKLRRKNEDRN